MFSNPLVARMRRCGQENIPCQKLFTTFIACSLLCYVPFCHVQILSCTNIDTSQAGPHRALRHVSYNAVPRGVWKRTRTTDEWRKEGEKRKTRTSRQGPEVFRFGSDLCTAKLFRFGSDLCTAKLFRFGSNLCTAEVFPKT